MLRLRVRASIQRCAPWWTHKSKDESQEGRLSGPSESTCSLRHRLIAEFIGPQSMYRLPNCAAALKKAFLSTER